MRRLLLTLLASTLLALSSGCRVLPDMFPCYRTYDSFVDGWDSHIRRPADWCWGNCSVAQDAENGIRIDGVNGVEPK